MIRWSFAHGSPLILSSSEDWDTRAADGSHFPSYYHGFAALYFPYLFLYLFVCLFGWLFIWLLKLILGSSQDWDTRAGGRLSFPILLSCICCSIFSNFFWLFKIFISCHGSALSLLQYLFLWLFLLLPNLSLEHTQAKKFFLLSWLFVAAVLWTMLIHPIGAGSLYYASSEIAPTINSTW